MKHTAVLTCRWGEGRARGGGMCVVEWRGTHGAVTREVMGGLSNLIRRLHEGGGGDRAVALKTHMRAQKTGLIRGRLHCH